MAPLVINQKFPAVGRSGREPTDAVLKAAEMFGIGLDESYEVTLYDRLALDVRPGDVVFVTGPSGSGKSVLLGRLREALGVAWPDAAVADLAAVTLSGERPVIDLFEGPLERRLRVLSTAGLADAFLLLRTPAELSDGQRYRLKLALAIQQWPDAHPAPVPGPDIGPLLPEDGRWLGQADPARPATSLPEPDPGAVA